MRVVALLLELQNLDYERTAEMDEEAEEEKKWFNQEEHKWFKIILFLCNHLYPKFNKSSILAQ